MDAKRICPPAVVSLCESSIAIAALGPTGRLLSDCNACRRCLTWVVAAIDEAKAGTLSPWFGDGAHCSGAGWGLLVF